jgi:hypothetical protein
VWHTYVASVKEHLFCDALVVCPDESEGELGMPFYFANPAMQPDTSESSHLLWQLFRRQLIFHRPQV